MKYWVRVSLAVVITVISITACAWALYRLIHTGTCASGGPYVSARPCPSGTGLQIMALIGGIFGMGLGLGLYALRGEADPPAHRSRIGFGVLAYSLLMLSLAAGALLAAFGPGATGGTGAELGGGIAAGVMLVIGVPPLLSAWRGPSELTLPATGWPTVAIPTTPPPAPTSASTPRPEGDQLSKLEQLGQLRKSGVLTEEEFERQKQQILGGG